MSDTPRTDAAEFYASDAPCSAYLVTSDFARELERENASLREQLRGAWPRTHDVGTIHPPTGGK